MKQSMKHTLQEYIVSTGLVGAACIAGIIYAHHEQEERNNHQLQLLLCSLNESAIHSLLNSTNRGVVFEHSVGGMPFFLYSKRGENNQISINVFTCSTDKKAERLGSLSQRQLQKRLEEIYQSRPQRKKTPPFKLAEKSVKNPRYLTPTNTRKQYAMSAYSRNNGRC